MNSGALIGGVAGFILGLFFFRSIILALIFSFVGRALGSRMGRGQYGSGGGFSRWGFNPVSDGPVFMETLFSMLGRLAAADGRVSPEEEQAFRNVVIHELGITEPASVASAMETFRRAASGSRPMGEFARKAAETFRSRPQLLEMMLIIMIRVTVAKGALHAEEDRLMAEAASIFGFHPGAYKNLKARYSYAQGGFSGSGGGQQSSANQSGFGSFNLKEAYSILEVAENASEAEIRKAYRKKAAEYHPDKIAAKGLPEEFTDLANAKFQEIQKAWEQIREARGF